MGWDRLGQGGVLKLGHVWLFRSAFSANITAWRALRKSAHDGWRGWCEATGR
eukprot:jgi/Bigna1/63867/fgenesh1_kg.61_\